MSVVLPNQEFYPEPKKTCFLCSGPAADGEPVVAWFGVSQDLYLHGGCAGSFVLRLARDAWQVERDADDGAFTLTPHTRRPPASPSQ